MYHKHTLTPLIPLLLFSGCMREPQPPMSDELFGEPVEIEQGRGERARWCREQIIQDNRDLFEREPALTRGKLRKMASSPYAYFRGTASLYWQDMLTPGEHRMPTQFANADTSHILLVGDAHPENIGTFKDADGVFHTTFNDFDAATYGPYHIELRRLLLGMSIFFEHAGSSEEEVSELTRAGVTAYIHTIHNTSTSFAEFTSNTRQPRVIQDLLRRAQRDGDIKEELQEYAPLHKEQQNRQMFIGELEPWDERFDLFRDTLRELPTQTYAELEDALIEYTSTTLHPDTHGTFFTMKGASQRLGAGVSSYPVKRYYVLIEGDTTEPEDDILLEFKETLLPPQSLAKINTLNPPQYPSSAARVVSAQRALQPNNTLDPLLGHATTSSATRSWKVRTRTKYQKGIDRERFAEKRAEGEWTHQDMIEFAQFAGQLLAHTHIQAPSLSPRSFQDALIQLTHEKQDKFIDENILFIETYNKTQKQDYERFRALLSIHGDDLGYRIQSSSPRSFGPRSGGAL